VPLSWDLFRRMADPRLRAEQGHDACSHRHQDVPETVLRQTVDRERRLADRELNAPYLRIETDYLPSDSARIAVRVEGLFETVRAASPG